MGSTAMTTRTATRLVCLVFLLSSLIAATGCEKDQEPLTLDDLSGDEYVVVERMVVLERAKAVALLDRASGEAILDSLAVAWGDSSLEMTILGAPRDPVRAEAVATLLRRIMEAEQESLKTSSGLERLTNPLLDPPPVPEPEPEEPSES